MINIKKVSESWSQITGDMGDLLTIKDHLTFDAPSARFDYRFRKGLWDGKIRLIKADGKIYTGLIDEVNSFCKRLSIPCTVEGLEKNEKVDKKELIEKIDSWKPTRFNGSLERIPLKPHVEQIQGIWLALSLKRCILESATAAGKSFIIWSICRYLVEEFGYRILILGSKVDLGLQLKENKHEYFQDWEQGLDVIYAGQEYTNQNIVVATRQSVIKQDKEFFENFDVVIEDEVHEGEAKQFSTIMESCVNAQYRIGLTGSLKESKTHKLTLIGLFGSIYTLSKAKDNIAKGISAPVEITVIKKHWKDVKFKPNAKKWDTGERYKKEVEWIATSEKRAKLVSAIVQKFSGISVVLFDRNVHGELLKSILKETNKKTFLIYGKVNPNDRKKIRDYANKNPDEKIVIVASLKTFATGINIPEIKNIVLACSMKRTNTHLKQGIGRGLRNKSDGSKLRFVDIQDDFGRGSKLIKHGLGRIELYIEEEFPYKILQI